MSRLLAAALPVAAVLAVVAAVRPDLARTGPVLVATLGLVVVTFTGIWHGATSPDGADR
ncbi:hypothetical protein [Cellulomonas oligotrophica]|uniref:Uncharacterized protein n=1 Tax=Cellulomonas oligotrophica TaxID=931536 RepID=A0A7Y9K0E9_9CELL|nr:hypothetical protein [Cellulomonas oligotrophica]NYD87799.1 hypothetical protein [Cellulomonas oligotrophica]GIG32996.1 hypothetical protein Col01nite_21550 [Cellulomonas oligotrophica]